MKRIAAIAVGTLFLALFALASSFAFRNRDHLGRSWNCMRFQEEPAPNLRALHEAQLAFRAKHGHFTTDLVALGFEPRNGGSPSVFYGYGFTQPSTGPLADGEDPSRSLSLDRKVTVSRSDFPATTATADRFTAAAVSVHIPEAGVDIWTIDETGRLVHEENGCWD